MAKTPIFSGISYTLNYPGSGLFVFIRGDTGTVSLHHAPAGDNPIRVYPRKSAAFSCSAGLHGIGSSRQAGDEPPRYVESKPRHLPIKKIFEAQQKNEGEQIVRNVNNDGCHQCFGFLVQMPQE